MYSRDYVYVRRYSVDQENNVMVLVSRYVLLPGAPAHPISWVLHACCLRAGLHVLGALMVKPGPHSSQAECEMEGIQAFL